MGNESSTPKEQATEFLAKIHAAMDVLGIDSVSYVFESQKTDDQETAWTP